MIIKRLLYLIFVLQINLSVESLKKEKVFWKRFVIFNKLLTIPWFIFGNKFSCNYFKDCAIS